MDLSFPESIVERAVRYPNMIEFESPYIACCGAIDAHTDEDFPRWSAFLCLRNDDCTVWQEDGYVGAPTAGECFTLNIHKYHGVRALKNGVLVLLVADGATKRSAENRLAKLVAERLSIGEATEESGRG